MAGVKFGTLAKISGVTFFRLSPHEQRAFAGAIDGAGRWWYRSVKNFVQIAPMFMFTYAVMQWATEENRKMHRKNPKDYENDT